jgi:hypothetical protein
MASPVAAVRQPLSTRTVNTANALYSNPTTPTKQSAHHSHKRSHAQFTSGQENVTLQSQIFNVLAAKLPSPSQSRHKPRVLVSTFKQPLPRATTRARPSTQDARTQGNLPVQEDLELETWRKSTRGLIERGTFYFDSLDQQFEHFATAVIHRLHGVRPPHMMLTTENSTILF